MMARKAKKRVHSMPRLGWKDMLLYWSVMFLTFGGAIAVPFFSIYYRGELASANTDLLTYASGEGGVHFLWLMILLFVCGLVVAAGPYQYRIPIFGRKDIKYGPPTYPRRYPLLMKNKPKIWRSAKKIARKKKFVITLTSVLLFACVFSIAMYPRSFYGRYELMTDGTVIVYDSYNRKSEHYEIGDIESVCLDVNRTGKGVAGRRRYARVTITFLDGKDCSFSVRSFGDDWISAIRTVQLLIERYGASVYVEDTAELWRVVQDQNLNTDEEELLYQLFEVK